MPVYYKPGTRRKNRHYVVRGRIDGREYEVRTQSADKASAEEHWIRFRATVRQGADARSRDAATFDFAAELYRASRELSRNDARYIDKLSRHLAGKLLKDLRPADFIAAASALYPGTKPQTRNRQALVPAAAVMHYAAENELCDWIRLRKLREDDPERPLVYPEDVPLDSLDGPLLVLVATLVYQGWRITETLNVRREDVDFDNKSVRRFVSKSRKWKWTPLDDGVCELWQDLPERRDGYLFPWRDRQTVYKKLDEAGLGDYRPHMSRRGFATALIEADTDLKSIMAAGGWEDITSVLLYADANIAQSRRTIGKIRARMRAKKTENK